MKPPFEIGRVPGHVDGHDRYQIPVAHGEGVLSEVKALHPSILYQGTEETPAGLLYILEVPESFSEAFSNRALAIIQQRRGDRRG